MWNNFCLWIKFDNNSYVKFVMYFSMNEFFSLLKIPMKLIIGLLGYTGFFKTISNFDWILYTRRYW